MTHNFVVLTPDCRSNKSCTTATLSFVLTDLEQRATATRTPVSRTMSIGFWLSQRLFWATLSVEIPLSDAVSSTTLKVAMLFYNSFQELCLL